MIGMGKFVDFFRDQVLRWQTALGEVEMTLKILMLVQRQWGSLEVRRSIIKPTART
jgi:dynein heavy chain